MHSAKVHLSQKEKDTEDITLSNVYSCLFVAKGNPETVQPLKGSV